MNRAWLIAIIWIICVQCPSSSAVKQSVFCAWNVRERWLADFDSQADLCTHLIYAGGKLDARNLLIKKLNADEKAFLHHLKGYVVKNRAIKVIFSLGGWADSADSSKYARLVGDERNRSRFVNNTVEFIRKYDLDGFMMDWRYPRCWQKDCTQGNVSETQYYTELMQVGKH